MSVLAWRTHTYIQSKANARNQNEYNGALIIKRQPNTLLRQTTEQNKKNYRHRVHVYACIKYPFEIAREVEQRALN